MKTSIVFSLVVAITLFLSSPFALAQAGPRVWTSGMNNTELYSSFIVKYRDGTTKQASADTAQAALKQIITTLKHNIFTSAVVLPISIIDQHRMGLGADVLKINYSLDSANAQTLMHQIALDPDVEYVQPNYIVHGYAAPNDPLYHRQWHYSNPNTGARLPAAWDLATGKGIVVAVVDSGYLNNTDLLPNLLPGYDMISEPLPPQECFILGLPVGCGGSNRGLGRRSGAFDYSNVGHGTHVAGTIAAVTNNNLGVAGVAYDAKVLPVRVLGNNNRGRTNDILDGIRWAGGINLPNIPLNPNPAKIINLSLGREMLCSPLYQEAINDVTARGIIVVVAAGNNNNDVATVTPANCKNVITVAASNRQGRRAYYSNFGAGIDITAPGGQIFRCPANYRVFLPLNVPPQNFCPLVRIHQPEQGVFSTVGNNNFDFDHGTSMAAPHISGIIALIQSVSTTPKTTDQLKNILRRTARPIAPASCPGGCGPGIVDAGAAVRMSLE